MKRQEQWRPVLDAEVQRWQTKSCNELVVELQDEQVYEVEFEGKAHQVEIQILENTEKYLHVLISVDDGSLPASLFPLSQSFIALKEK